MVRRATAVTRRRWHGRKTTLTPAAPSGWRLSERAGAGVGVYAFPVKIHGN